MTIGLKITIFIISCSSITISKGNKPPVSCYQCEVSNNAQCTEDYLKECPSNQAYDRCMTIVTKSAEVGYRISKKCALGPCLLRDLVGNDELGLDDCDKSKAEYDCHYCCQGHGCNKNSAQPMPHYTSYQLFRILYIYLGLFLYFS